MIYPKKLSGKKSIKIINMLLFFSIIISAILILINKLTTPNIYWSYICIAGIIYVWITTVYALKRITNIASHVLLQMISTSIIVFYIDKLLNFHGWSISIGIPIILIVANTTMLVLSIISSKKYIKYAIYQLIIVLVSIIQFIFILNNNIEFKILNIISVGISLLNFVVSLILNHKNFLKIIVCKFHI